jgi:hypothetical protein
MNKPEQRQLDLKQLAALTQDLEQSHLHRARGADGLLYVLDANVMWFYQNQLDDIDDNIKGYVADAIGLQNAANLIRTSLEKLATRGHGFSMLKPHKFETDVAFASDLPEDYDDLRSVLTVAFEDALSKASRSSAPENFARQFVSILKKDYRRHFLQLTDILARKPERKMQIDAMTRTLSVADYGRSPPELDATLKKIGFILREIDKRPTFSVLQDINALRDLALFNAAKGVDRAVLVTFDKRLLQAIRLVQSWKEPWAEYLTVESCQTFWVWYLTDSATSDDRAAVALKEVMHDFRLKSRQLFRPEAAVGEASQAIWLTNRTALENYCHARKDGCGSANGEATPKSEIIAQLEKSLQAAKALEAHVLDDVGSFGESAEIVQKASRSFFYEVEEILPSFQLIISDVFERETYLERMLGAHKMRKETFFDALNEEIQVHARSSLRILGASSLVAPKTIQAIYRYSEMDQGKPSARKFIHRVPLPVQSDEFDLNEVVALVLDDQTKLEARYDKLLRVLPWRGPVSDLIVAYLLASSGSWEDAEDLCRSQLSMSRRAHRADPISYEMHILLASILRIYRTTFPRLRDAERLLRDAQQSGSPRPKADREDIRIKLELIAIKLNRHLLDRYRTGLPSGQSVEADLRDAREIAEPLLALKDAVANTASIPDSLREKINANINVNYCLVTHFVSPPEGKSIFANDSFRQILRESVYRMSEQKARISFFEEIVMSFAILNHSELFDRTHYSELEIVTKLRSRLSRVLQRDVRINDFEIWIYSHIQGRLNELWYQK